MIQMVKMWIFENQKRGSREMVGVFWREIHKLGHTWEVECFMSNLGEFGDTIKDKIFRKSKTKS